MTTSQTAVTKTDRGKAIFAYWPYPAIALPFLILGWWEGFGTSFQSGAVSAFMCGTIIAALGENLFEHVKDGFSHFKKVLKSKNVERSTAVLALTITLGFFFWNMYFAVADKTVRHPSVDWVQVAVFIVSALLLPQARFAFTELERPKLKDLFRWYRWIFGLYGKAFRWGFELGQKAVRAHPKSPATAPEEVERNSLDGTAPASSPPPAST